MSEAELVPMFSRKIDIRDAYLELYVSVTGLYPWHGADVTQECSCGLPDCEQRQAPEIIGSYADEIIKAGEALREEALRLKSVRDIMAGPHVHEGSMVGRLPE